jgi:hypothetical protein
VLYKLKQFSDHRELPEGVIGRVQFAKCRKYFFMPGWFSLFFGPFLIGKKRRVG